MIMASVPTEIEVPVTGDVVEGSLQEASAKIIQSDVSDEITKDYKVVSKELLLKEFGLDGADEASQWLDDNVSPMESFANEKAYWFTAYLKLTNKN